MNMHALRVAFLSNDEATRAALIAEFEQFAAREPLLWVPVRLARRATGCR